MASTEQHVADDQAERIDVRPLIDRLGPRLFRRHVPDRPDHLRTHGHGVRGRGGARPRDAEVHDHGVIGLVHHDVGGLQIPMHDPRVVGRQQAGGDLPGDGQRSLDRQPALLLEDRCQVRSLDVRHRDVLDAVDLADVVDADDVPVRDLSGEQQFALEPAFELLRDEGLRGEVGPNHLDRDCHLQDLVPRLVDGAHPTHAEQPDDVVPGPKFWPTAIGSVCDRRDAGGREYWNGRDGGFASGSCGEPSRVSSESVASRGAGVRIPAETAVSGMGGLPHSGQRPALAGAELPQ